MKNTIACDKAHSLAAKLTNEQKEAIIVTVCEIITSEPTIAEDDLPGLPSQDIRPRRKLTKRASVSPIAQPTMPAPVVPMSQQTLPPTPPTAIHPALRPISVFSSMSSSTDSSTYSTSTVGRPYESMSSGSRPTTQWTVGQDYDSMRPGIIPNSDWTTGLTFDEMRAASGVTSSNAGSEKKGWMRAYKEEVKDNFRSFDRAFWGR